MEEGRAIAFPRAPVPDSERSVDIEHEIAQTSQPHSKEHGGVYRDPNRTRDERSELGDPILSHRDHDGMDNRFEVFQCSRIREHDATELAAVYLAATDNNPGAESFDDPSVFPAQRIVAERINIDDHIPGIFQDPGRGVLAGTVLSGDSDDDQWRAPQLAPVSTETRSGTVNV